MSYRLRFCVFCGWGVVLLGGGFSGLQACGPWFPESMLDQPKAALRQPFVSFETEVRKVPAPADAAPAVARPVAEPVDEYAYYRSRVAAVVGPEARELEALLAGEPEERRREVVENYRALREAMLAHYFYTEEDDRRGLDLSTKGEALLVAAEQGRWPSGVPKDVMLYLQGALQYHHGDKAGAVETWKRLLALPADQRQNRSVAAAWMIAMETRDTAGFEAALPWYEMCAQLSAEGFRDCLGLGLASLGWEARYYLDKGERRKAAELYYHQAMGGDETGWLSLRQSLPEIDNTSDEELTEWARVPFLRGVMTADLLRTNANYDVPTGADGAEDMTTRWLGAIERAETGQVEEAGRLAELAYSSGHFALAKRWLGLAAKDDTRALWVRGKIALMEGDTAAAEKDLWAARAGFSRDEAKVTDSISLDSGLWLMPMEETEAYRVSQFYGDLGTTLLARDRYSDALDALNRGAFFQDAGYVAERVLTPGELLAYVRREYPEAVAIDPERERYERPRANWLRYLLARRLGRMRSFQTARSFYPAEVQPVWDRYTELMRKSRADQPKAERAQALWEAAQIHRAAGMELFGTEGAPDNFCYDGSYGEGPTGWDRVGVVFGEKPSWWRSIDAKEFIPRATEGERERVLRSRLPYEKRFEYRYVAADMAWQAAQLMPNNSEETARVLGIAGRWLEKKDPKAADRFYKAMIWRNWSTPLAREADEKRWFPEIAWDYDPWAAAGVQRPEGY